MSKGWIGVDLDGTLAEYETFIGPEHIGAPIPAMVSRIKVWLANGHEVRIFTARVCGLWLFGQHSEPYRESLKAMRAIEKWLVDVADLPLLPITCVKDFSMDELYDDRCVPIEKNTGRMLAPSPRGLATP